MKKIYILFLSVFFMAAHSQSLEAEIFEINHQTGSNPQYLQKYNDQLIFWTGDLWKYDFTTKKSTLIKKIFPYTPQFSSNPQFTLFKNKVYFLVDISSITQLWSTDGTESGTSKIFDFPDDYVTQITADENKIFITERNNVYISDGTAAGTKLLKQMEGQTLETKAFKFESNFIFAAKNTNYSNELWITNSVDDATAKIKIEGTENPLYIHTTLNCFNLNGNLLFYAQNAEGTQQGLWSLNKLTKKAKFIFYTRGADKGEILNDQLIFFGNTVENGANLFVTDGTVGNTNVLSSQMHFTSGSQDEIGLQRLGNYVYFFPRTGERNRLWKTDGTLAGTVATSVLIPNDFAANIIKYYPVNQRMMIENSGHTSFYLMDQFENLSTMGQNRLDNAIEDENTLIFPFYNKKFGQELFEYNFDTKTIQLFNDTKHEAGSNPLNIVANGNQNLIFTATDGEFGNQFYKIQAKGEIPQILKSSNVTQSLIPAGNLFKVGTYHYVKPENYSGTIAKTNGQAENTKILNLPGYTTVENYSSFGNLKDEALIIATYNSSNDRKIQVFKNDIGSDYFELLKEIPTGSTISKSTAVSYNGSVYFTVYTADYKTEIWKTDGTSAGTKLAFNIPDDPYYSNMPRFLQAYDNHLLIAKNNRFWSYESSAGELKEIPFPQDEWGMGQWNISENMIEIEGKLYFLSQNGFGKVYKLDNMQSVPKVILSSNDMNIFSDFKKCGNQLYFGSGNNQKINNLWSINLQDDSSNPIITKNSNFQISDLTCANNYLYYRKASSNQIWRTNGTAASTIALPITVSNEEQIAGDDEILRLIEFQNSLYFVAKTKTSGEELYGVTTPLPVYLNVGDATPASQKIKLMLYPNPASAFVKIKGASELRIETFKIYDLTGRLVSSGKYISENQNIDISKLSSGNYIIEVTTLNGSQFAQKFIKK